MLSQKVNWDLSDKHSKDTVTCKCGMVYRSHTRIITLEDKRLKCVSRELCPRCGKDDDMKKVESDKHTMEL